MTTTAKEYSIDCFKQCSIDLKQLHENLQVMTSLKRIAKLTCPKRLLSEGCRISQVPHPRAHAAGKIQMRQVG